MTFFHTIGQLLRSWFEAVPLSAARWMMIAVFLGMLFWVVQIPTKSAVRPDLHHTWYEDLRIWAWVTLMCQIVIYSMF